MYIVPIQEGMYIVPIQEGSIVKYIVLFLRFSMFLYYKGSTFQDLKQRPL